MAGILDACTKQPVSFFPLSAIDDDDDVAAAAPSIFQPSNVSRRIHYPLNLSTTPSTNEKKPQRRPYTKKKDKISAALEEQKRVISGDGFTPVARPVSSELDPRRKRKLIPIPPAIRRSPPLVNGLSAAEKRRLHSLKEKKNSIKSNLNKGNAKKEKGETNRKNRTTKRILPIDQYVSASSEEEEEEESFESDEEKDRLQVDHFDQKRRNRLSAPTSKRFYYRKPKTDVSKATTVTTKQRRVPILKKAKISIANERDEEEEDEREYERIIEENDDDDDFSNDGHQ